MVLSTRGYNLYRSLTCRNKQTSLYNIEPFRVEICGVSLRPTTCFKFLIISRTKYLFLSSQSAMSVRKRAGFLSLNWISELVLDSENYEAGATSDSSSEEEGGFEYVPGVSHLQPDRPTSRGHASSSSFSSNAFDEDEIFVSRPG